ncbi:MAG: GMC family oxidoreductase [Sandaracinaceae bacterium]|nr:GMC family oxidoreductase [Sandaracinaceae bacterium]
MSSEGFDTDFLVIGSGFGGSVSALRLIEKGYSVHVIEAGKRWAQEDFPKTNWNLRKYLWMPALRFYGIQKITLLRNVMVLSGAGVGGGSLVYANTLLVPPKAFFDDPRWSGLDEWQAGLAPHYETAKRMLGASPSKFLGPGDKALREIADEMGRGETFHQPSVAVYFGEPNKTVPDPFFGGEGPERTGCNFCGGCMVGCRFGAKNTLDKNYLYLAEKRGAVVHAERTVERVEPLPGGGYAVHIVRTTAFFRSATRRVMKARNVVFAGGVMGTVKLLLEQRASGALPELSARLGEYVRTNSEAIVGVVSRSSSEDHSRGVAITSGFHPDDHTHIEVVRYGDGQDAMGRLATLMVDGGRGRLRRFFAWLGEIAKHPIDFLRSFKPWGWAKRTTILLVMQTVDNHMRMKLRRPWWWPFQQRLDTTIPDGQVKPPTYLPVANLTARKMAARVDGVAVGAINEAFLDVPTTAHILGGCPMGRTKDEGVINANHEVHGYPGLYVCDGSAISANLGVNPSLTICALTERAMSHIPSKSV